MELEAILAENQANLVVLDVDEVQEVPEVVDLVDPRELQEHRRKKRLVEMDNWCYLILLSQV